MEKKEKYHFLYKTVCRVTNKYYIGVHSTYNLEDGYLGSGKLLVESVKKYGKENHIREIIKFYDTNIEKFIAENEYITNEILSDPLCLNICYGGYGGIKNIKHLYNFLEASKKTQFMHANSHGALDKLKELRKNPDWNAWYKTRVKPCDWTGRKHREETKKNIGELNSILQKGEKNSQYGTMWITNGKESKKIIKGCSTPDGWKMGRVCKKS